jgi:hypothetical protein
MPERLPTLPERRDVKAALRAAGLSDRQVRALLDGGWAALVGEARAENEELREEIEQLKRTVGAP